MTVAPMTERTVTTPVPSKRHRSVSPPWLARKAFQVVGPAAPGAMGWLAAKLWFTPPRMRPPQSEKALWETAEDRFTVTVGGRRVRGHARGQGRSVLLLHGWGGRGAQWATFVEPLVAQGFRVVVIDGPAHGASDGRDTDAIEWARAIEAVAARERGLHGIVAHSFGSICAAFAVKRWINVARLAMIAPPARLRTMTGMFSRALCMPPLVAQRLEQRIERRFDLGPRLWEEGNADWNARHFAIPGLIIHDRDDPVVPYSQGRLIADAWEAAQLTTTEGLGHFRVLKDPGVIRQVGDFLD